MPFRGQRRPARKTSRLATKHPSTEFVFVQLFALLDGLPKMIYGNNHRCCNAHRDCQVFDTHLIVSFYVWVESRRDDAYRFRRNRVSASRF